MEVAMNDLSRESRALIAAARHRDGLSVADKDRIRNKLTGRLGAGLALGSAVTAGATAAEAARTTALAAASAWLPGAAKVLGVVAIAGGVTVGAVHATRHRAVTVSAVHANAPAARAPAPPTQAKPAPVEALQPPVAEAHPEPTPVELAPAREAPAVKRESHGSAAPSPASEAEANPKPTDDGLSGQIIAIREARAAIRRGDGAAALAALDKGLPQGQGGALEPEATLARVSALCLQGDVAGAKRIGEGFLARFPDSLLAARIRSSCAFGAATSP
jgi:hypothetical protein